MCTFIEVMQKKTVASFFLDTVCHTNEIKKRDRVWKLGYWNDIMSYNREINNAVAGPRAWNSLPQFVIDCSSPGTFRKYLKTYLISLSF